MICLETQKTLDKLREVKLFCHRDWRKLKKKKNNLVLERRKLSKKPKIKVKYIFTLVFIVYQTL